MLTGTSPSGSQSLGEEASFGPQGLDDRTGGSVLETEVGIICTFVPTPMALKEVDKPLTEDAPAPSCRRVKLKIAFWGVLLKRTLKQTET